MVGRTKQNDRGRTRGTVLRNGGAVADLSRKDCEGRKLRDLIGDVVLTLAISVILTILIIFIPTAADEKMETMNAVTEPSEEIQLATETETEEESLETSGPLHIRVPDEEEQDYFDDLELLSYLIMSEAGNQERLGKILVCDTVLNRVESPFFPNTVHDVIYAPGQFAVVSNGSLYKYEPTEDIYEIITEEIRERTNDKVVYFNAIGFTKAGEAWEKVGDHYFSYIAKRLQQ